ncbi:MAG: hypothetical protein Q9204_008162, partial [Flavoplaca sp. TL-2023a]
MSSAGEGSPRDRNSVKMEDSELDWYSMGTADERHDRNQLIDAATEDYSMPNQTIKGTTPDTYPTSRNRRVSTSDSPRNIVEEIEDNPNPLTYGAVFSSQPNRTGPDPSSADEGRRTLQRRLLSSEATNPERQVGPTTLSYCNNQPQICHLNPPDSPQWVPTQPGLTTTPSMPYENTSGTENLGYGNVEFETDPATTQPQASQLPDAHNPPLLRFQGTYITIPPEQQIPSRSTEPLPQFNHQEQHPGLQPYLDTDGGMAASHGHPATPTIQDMPTRPVLPQANQYQLLAQQQQRFLTNSRE